MIVVMTQKSKAVFLDRDGTIIRHVDLMYKPEQLYLLPGVAKAIRKLNKNQIERFTFLGV